MIEKLIKILCCWIPHKKTRKKVRKKLANTLVKFGHIYYKSDLLYPFVCSKNQLIKPEYKCLIIAPHPDDESIGCGGIMAKYGSQIDCICINSSGVKYKTDTKEASEIADERISEFHSVMSFFRIAHHWIFKIWGNPPHFDKIMAHTSEYLRTLDFKKYDYIFVPDRMDGHREHRFLTNYFIPQLIKKSRYNKRSKIVFYGVWSTVTGPNYFEDISQVIDKKVDGILLYKSRTKNVDNYAMRIKGLNYYYGLVSGVKYAEAYKVISINEYLAYQDDKAWAKIM